MYTLFYLLLISTPVTFLLYLTTYLGPSISISKREIFIIKHRIRKIYAQKFTGRNLQINEINNILSASPPAIVLRDISPRMAAGIITKLTGLESEEKIFNDINVLRNSAIEIKLLKIEKSRLFTMLPSTPRGLKWNLFTTCIDFAVLLLVSLAQLSGIRLLFSLYFPIFIDKMSKYVTTSALLAFIISFLSWISNPNNKIREIDNLLQQTLTNTSFLAVTSASIACLIEILRIYTVSPPQASTKNRSKLAIKLALPQLIILFLVMSFISFVRFDAVNLLIDFFSRIADLNIGTGIILTLSIIILPFYTRHTLQVIRSYIHTTLRKITSILYYAYYIFFIIGIFISSNLIPSALSQPVAIIGIFIMYSILTLIFLIFFISLPDAYRDSLKYNFNFGQYGIACSILLTIYTAPGLLWMLINFSFSPILLIIHYLTKVLVISDLFFLLTFPLITTSPIALLAVVIFIHYHHWYRKNVENMKNQTDMKILSSPNYFKNVYRRTLIETKYNYKIYAKITWNRIIN